MSVSKHFSLGVGLVVIGKFLAGMSRLLTTFFLVRLLDKEDVGVIRFLQMIAGTVAWLVAAGIPKSLLYFLPQHDVQRQKAICWQNLILFMGCGMLFKTPLSEGLDFTALQETLCFTANPYPRERKLIDCRSLLAMLFFRAVL